MIIGHESAVAIRSQGPPEDAQFAHIHQLQFLAEFHTLKLCCFVEIRNERQEAVMLNIIFLHPVTNKTSTVTWLLISQLKTIFLIIGSNKIENF